MLYALVVFLVIGSAAMMMNEGAFSAAVILICTVLAGLTAFNYYEPAADLLESAAPFLGGYGEIIALLGIFSVAVTFFRIVTEYLAPSMIEFPEILHRGGGVVIGAWIGWVMAGILLCALQTLPLPPNFLGYDALDLEPKSNGWNADRYWLAFVHRCGDKVFDRNPAQPFDPQCDFGLRYQNARRGGSDEPGAMRPAAAPPPSKPTEEPARPDAAPAKPARPADPPRQPAVAPDDSPDPPAPANEPETPKRRPRRPRDD